MASRTLPAARSNALFKANHAVEVKGEGEFPFDLLSVPHGVLEKRTRATDLTSDVFDFLETPHIPFCAGFSLYSKCKNTVEHGVLVIAEHRSAHPRLHPYSRMTEVQRKARDDTARGLSSSANVIQMAWPHETAVAFTRGHRCA